MSYLIDFLNEHPNDWEEIITGEPYFIKVKRDEELPNLVLFMYDQIHSDFYNPIVKECRGIIVDMATAPYPVCWAFDKFGNFGEGYVDEIDWSTARVQEKVDGSIVKLFFYNNHWYLASNSCIQAKNAKLESGYDLEQLFLKAIAKYHCSSLDEFAERFYLGTLVTYIFELISPYNQVVVQYPNTDIYFIGARDITTEKEIDFKYDITKAELKYPKSYSLSTLEDCIDAAKALNVNGSVENEGFVVVDANWHRIKVKSPDYVAMHHLANGFSREDLLHIIRAGEIKEVLTYFPKYEMAIKEMARDYDSYRRKLIAKNFTARKRWKELNGDRKAFALEWKDKNFSEVFKLLDMDWKWNKYIKELTDKQLLKNIERHIHDTNR